MPENCDLGGSAASRPGVLASRAAYQLPASQGPRTLIAAASWLPKADSGGIGGDVGAILLSYRRAVRLLVQARVSFGVTLGHLLPEEQMATAARWTGRALRVAGDLGDRTLLAS